MTLKDGKKLDNILSVSTAASNKFLFHFDSYHALTQWTAGIRLAMYEHTTLSEAYTGALIAGKGKTLNNIRMILDRQCAKYEDWVRVRFGAGTPWRRCWCVVSPPDEKEYIKLQKLQKKGSAYERPPVLKGDIKFYETKKVTKKTKAIATVKDAYSCYAIYPQSKPLIDQSTLVKIEGKITIHSTPESTTEGFVFVMPESRPAISGFEIMLQYLFPVFDTFSLYGRPKKLIADVLDTRGLMFAMPSDRRYGYLEMWDVVGLINTEGSDKWSERQWRKQLKDLTSTRMMSANQDAEHHAVYDSKTKVLFALVRPHASHRLHVNSPILRYKSHVVLERLPQRTHSALHAISDRYRSKSMDPTTRTHRRGSRETKRPTKTNVQICPLLRRVMSIFLLLRSTLPIKSRPFVPTCLWRSQILRSILLRCSKWLTRHMDRFQVA